MGYSGAGGGGLIHEKNQKQNISWRCPFKLIFSQRNKGPSPTISETFITSRKADPVTR